MQILHSACHGLLQAVGCVLCQTIRQTGFLSLAQTWWISGKSICPQSCKAIREARGRGSAVCEDIRAAWFGSLRKCWGLQAEHPQGCTSQHQCQGTPVLGGHPDLLGQCHPEGCDFQGSSLLLATKSKGISKEKNSHEEIPHPWALGNLVSSQAATRAGCLLNSQAVSEYGQCADLAPLQSSNMYIYIYTLLFKNESHLQ